VLYRYFTVELLDHYTALFVDVLDGCCKSIRSLSKCGSHASFCHYVPITISDGPAAVVVGGLVVVGVVPVGVVPVGLVGVGVGVGWQAVTAITNTRQVTNRMISLFLS